VQEATAAFDGEMARHHAAAICRGASRLRTPGERFLLRCRDGVFALSGTLAGVEMLLAVSRRRTREP